MTTVRRTIPATLALLFVAAACSETPTKVPQTSSRAPGAASTAAASASARSQGALTVQGTDHVDVEIPLTAPCLGLSQPLQLAGTWHIRYSANRTPRGQVHYAEHLDYSDVPIVPATGDGPTWLPVPGASESIVLKFPGTEGSAEVRRHEFHARYRSQDGLPDLRVFHRVRILLGPDGAVRHEEVVIPFEGECV